MRIGNSVCPKAERAVARCLPFVITTHHSAPSISKTPAISPSGPFRRRYPRRSMLRAAVTALWIHILPGVGERCFPAEGCPPCLGPRDGTHGARLVRRYRRSRPSSAQSSNTDGSPGSARPSRQRRTASVRGCPWPRGHGWLRFKAHRQAAIDKSTGEPRARYHAAGGVISQSRQS